MIRLLPFLLLACAPDRYAEERDSGSGALVPGSPEAFGVVALLNDASTTVQLLDDEAGLNARAARNLIAHRDGPDGQYGGSDDDPFDDIDEVDAVPQIGPSTLQQLVDYAVSHGWVPNDDDVIGVFDNVEFTVAEAAATLELANTAEQAWLDDTLGLDRRAAGNIVGARPIADLPQLAGIPYVGESALQALKRAATTEPSATPLEERFVADLVPTIEYWYGQFGNDVAQAGGNTLEQALANLDPALVTTLTDPEEDPFGHDFDRFIVVTHPDVVWGGSGMVWFGIYDRVSGSLSGTNWYD